MDFSEDQIERFMFEAIEEGRKARGKSAPNPPVGCVLVRDGRVVSRGHTNEIGIHHAEAMALSKLEGDGDTAAFVTLEPCSFQGKTPSCALALISSSINCVFVGILDPDSRNNGTGIAMLRAAGIEVHTEILTDVVREDLEPYLLKSS